MISTAWAQSAGGLAGSGLTSFLPLILIAVVFYFLLIRPQQKKQKEHQAKLSNIRRGDKIITGGGFYGLVTKVINEQEIEVEIATGVKVRLVKGSILDVLNKTEPAPAAEKVMDKPEAEAEEKTEEKAEK